MGSVLNVTAASNLRSTTNRVIGSSVLIFSMYVRTIDLITIVIFRSMAKTL